MSKKNSDGLSVNQELILDAINRHWAQHNQAPNSREIKSEAGIASINTVHYNLKRLAEMGFIVLAGPEGASRPATPPWVIEAIQNNRPEKYRPESEQSTGDVQ